jgi:hypothetical protein
MYSLASPEKMSRIRRIEKFSAPPLIERSPNIVTGTRSGSCSSVRPNRNWVYPRMENFSYHLLFSPFGCSESNSDFSP